MIALKSVFSFPSRLIGFLWFLILGKKVIEVFVFTVPANEDEAIAYAHELAEITRSDVRVLDVNVLDNEQANDYFIIEYFADGYFGVVFNMQDRFGRKSSKSSMVRKSKILYT